MLGLRLSQGAIANALARVAERAQPAVALIREQVRASPVQGSDETGARVAGRNWWHWVVQAPTASYHELAPSRSAAVIERFLAGTQPEVWLSDAFGAQLKTVAAAHPASGGCFAHQFRDLTFAEEADDEPGQRWARQLGHVFGRAVRLYHDRPAISPERFARRRARVVKAADRLVFGPPLQQGAAWKLQRRYRKWWAGLFVFLERDDVEPTNNGSERDLRNWVIHDKVTGGYRSEAGAQQGAIMATILTTARKQGLNIFEQLCQLAGPSPLQAASATT